VRTLGELAAIFTASEYYPVGKSLNVKATGACEVSAACKPDGQLEDLKGG
jgi:hypothetical protein